MLRIGPNATSNKNSAINIIQDTQRVGIQKDPTGEYILDVSGAINCDAIFVGGTQFTGSSGGGGVWTQDASGDISYGDGNVFIGAGLDVSGKLAVGGDVSANVFYGDGSNLTGISSSWVGTATSALNMGSNNITNVGSITATGTVSANSFAGDGSSLTGISSSWVGTADSALNMNSNNITNVGNVSASTFTGDGSNLTNITSSWVGTATSALYMDNPIYFNYGDSSNRASIQFIQNYNGFPLIGVDAHNAAGVWSTICWLRRGTASYFPHNITTSSDNRIKHNEENIQNALDLIQQLNPQKYLRTENMYDENYTLYTDICGNYTNLSYGDTVCKEYGVIAQDIEQIEELKFIVTDFDDDSSGNPRPKSVNYNQFIPLLIQGIKDLKAEKDALQTEVTDLKALLQSKGLLD